MHSDNEQRVPTTSRVADPPPAVAPTAFNNLSPRKDDNSEESRGFARGGNSIFGEPMVRDEKDSKLTSGIKMPLNGIVQLDLVIVDLRLHVFHITKILYYLLKIGFGKNFNFW